MIFKTNIVAFVTCFLLFLGEKAIYGQSIVAFSDTVQPQVIGKFLSVYEDKSSQLSAEQILKGTFLFQKVTTNVPNLGVSSSNHWVKFSIQNNTSKNKLLLNVAHAILDQVALYQVLDSNRVVMLGNMGEFKPFSARKYKHPNYIFDISIKPNETQHFLLKVNQGEQLMLPVILGTRDTILQSIRTQDLYFGLYCGIMFIMIFYNLFVYFSVRDRSYLLYVIYIIAVWLTQASFLGYTFQFLYPNSPWMERHSVIFWSAAVGIAAPEFMRFFLKTKEYTPKLTKLFVIPYTCYAIAVMLALFNKFSWSYLLIDVTAISITILMTIISIKIARKGIRTARFFLLAWFIFLIGVTVFALKDMGILPYNIFTIYLMPIGSAIETVLLSFALADRINIFRKEKEEAQLRELQERLEKQEILEKQNILLEQEIRAATKELVQKNEQLNEANQKLEVTLLELKQTQAQLIQTEKMASLGQMAAGIAHEINNPMNIINQSLDALMQDIGDLKALIDQYQKIEVNGNSLQEQLLEIEKFSQQIELESLYVEMDNMVSSAREGANRAAKIAKELKTFSRKDQESIKLFNIHEGLDALFDMFKSDLLGDIQIEKDYGDLPEINCNSQLLNQAFYNVIQNSAQAIRDKGLQDKEGKITIKTRIFNGQVLVSFTDNGIGMDESVIKRATEPFFTTKKVGSGKGLGLSVTYGILREHQGLIDIDSKVGIGTTISLIFPISLKYTDNENR